MKTSTLILALSFLALVYGLTAFAQTPPTASATPPSSLATPFPALPVPVAAPVVLVDSGAAKVQSVVNIIIAIIGGLGIVAGAFAVLWAKLMPLIAKVVADVENLRGRQDRQAANTGAMQRQIVDNARAVGVPLDPTLAPPRARNPGESERPGESGKAAPEFLILLGMIVGAALFLLGGCATDTGDARRNQRGRITNAVLEEAFNAALKVGLSAGEGAVNGWAIQNGASAIFDNPQVSIDGGAALEHIILAAAGPEAKPLAKAAAVQFDKANPKTPAEKAAVANTIGAGLQHAAAQVIYSDSQP